MVTKKTIYIDLSNQLESYINPQFLLSPENTADKLISDNKFGWGVNHAEVIIETSTKNILEYRLISTKGVIQSHAKKIVNHSVDYWRLEFFARNIQYQPDVFEPNINTFLEFYYNEYFINNSQLIIEQSTPLVIYQINEEGNLINVRYAMCVDSFYSNPLINIFITNQGFIQTITDWQSLECRHLVYPTPDYPINYLLQKHNEKLNKNLYQIENIKELKNNRITFKGFKDYVVNILTDKQLEVEFVKYGFFADEQRKIISEAELILKYIPTVNYHLIKPCNMRCRHCFSDFDEIKLGQLSYEDALKIIDEISRIKSFRKINFSGGEPTLFKGIEKLVQYAKEKGLETSMVSNGYNLIQNPSLLKSIENYLDLLVLSIDSFDNDENLKIGRHVALKTISIHQLIDLANQCHKRGIKIKINTVITKLNFQSLLADKISILQPIRWKIFKMLPVTNQNEKALQIHPSDNEFNTFLLNNKSIAENVGIKVVSEDNNEMTGSYIMISPDGKFFNNVDGSHNYSESILDIGIRNALNQTPLIREVFYKREGDYSCV